jgi:hypothetical protein
LTKPDSLAIHTKHYEKVSRPIDSNFNFLIFLYLDCNICIQNTAFFGKTQHNFAADLKLLHRAVLGLGPYEDRSERENTAYLTLPLLSFTKMPMSVLFYSPVIQLVVNIIKNLNQPNEPELLKSQSILFPTEYRGIAWIL